MQAQPVAVVDIGSNTVHLLVAHSDGWQVRPLVDQSVRLDLGATVAQHGGVGALQTGALLMALGRFVALARRHGAPTLHILATHALRAAADGPRVCAGIQTLLDTPVTVLDPATEAALAFTGAVAAQPAPGARAVLDIGGGSMQVAVGLGDTLVAAVSLPLGAAHLARTFLPGDPPTRAQEHRLRAVLADQIGPALPRPLPVSEVLATGGALRRLPQVIGRPRGKRLDHTALAAVYAGLHHRSTVTIATRYRVGEKRAPLLLPALLVALEVLHSYGNPPLRPVAWGLREGAVLHLTRQATGRSGPARVSPYVLPSAAAVGSAW